jgi:hypothetical protein
MKKKKKNFSIFRRTTTSQSNYYNIERIKGADAKLLDNGYPSCKLLGLVKCSSRSFEVAKSYFFFFFRNEKNITIRLV